MRLPDPLSQSLEICIQSSSLGPTPEYKYGTPLLWKVWTLDGQPFSLNRGVTHLANAFAQKRLLMHGRPTSDSDMLRVSDGTWQNLLTSAFVLNLPPRREMQTLDHKCLKHLILRRRKKKMSDTFGSRQPLNAGLSFRMALQSTGPVRTSHFRRRGLWSRCLVGWLKGSDCNVWGRLKEWMFSFAFRSLLLPSNSFWWGSTELQSKSFWSIWYCSLKTSIH